jgi:hypothetical protein
MSDETRIRKRIDFLTRGSPRPEQPRREAGFPGWRREGEFLLARSVRVHGGAVHPWPRHITPEARDPEELLFFDTETTGLSGGAGSVIFLMGMAWCEGLDLVAEQLFLSDFPGEVDFLHAVRQRFERFKAFVSYNGKAFDSRLLATRFIMNRIEFEIGHQIDLLHMARRLWRSLTGDCSLKTVESRILGISRDLDVAGEDIPLIYLEYLRTGRPGTLPVVFQHNLTDITSLARIWESFGGFFSGDLEQTPVDRKALGSFLLERKSDAGLTILRDAFNHGEMEAGVPLSLTYKRRREWEKATRIWESILNAERNLFAAMELAKYHEHKERNPARALEVVEEVLSWNLPLAPRERREIFKRKTRLLKKKARS